MCYAQLSKGWMRLPTKSPSHLWRLSTDQPKRVIMIIVRVYVALKGFFRGDLPCISAAFLKSQLLCPRAIALQRYHVHTAQNTSPKPFHTRVSLKPSKGPPLSLRPSPESRRNLSPEIVGTWIQTGSKLQPLASFHLKHVKHDFNYDNVWWNLNDT